MLIASNCMRLSIFHRFSSCWVAKIESLQDQDVLQAAIRTSPILFTENGHHDYAPRYSEFAIIAIDPRMSEETTLRFSDEDLNSIRQNRWRGDGQTARLHAICEKHGIDSHTMLNDWFTCLYLNVETSVIEGLRNSLVDCNVKCKVEDDQIVITPDSASPSTPIRSIICIHDNEIIVLPYTSNGELNNDLNKVSDRNSINPGVYWVKPCGTVLRRGIESRQISGMKVEAITQFFGSKRCGTKVETLIEGLRQTLRNSRAGDIRESSTEHLSAGDKLVVTFGSGSARFSPYHTIPNWVILNHGSQLKVVASEILNDRSLRMLLEVQANPVDDFGQMLYTFLEDHSSLDMIGFKMDAVQAAITKLQTGLPSGSTRV